MGEAPTPRTPPQHVFMVRKRVEWSAERNPAHGDDRTYHTFFWTLGEAVEAVGKGGPGVKVAETNYYRVRTTTSIHVAQVGPWVTVGETEQWVKPKPKPKTEEEKI